MSAGSLFDTLAVFENYPLDRRGLSEASRSLRVLGIEGRDATNYPLTLLVAPGERLYLRLDHDPGRLEAARSERAAVGLVRLLEAAVAAPDEPLHRLGVLDADERHTLLESFNATAHEVPNATLPALFEAQVARTPDAIAVVFGEQALSYAELNARANQLAHHLIGLGVGPEALVGIALERSIEMVVGLVGILKAGAAYLPLDPEYPTARLEQMLIDAAPAVVLTSEAVRFGLLEQQLHRGAIASVADAGVG